jgi:hypothetical protein
MLKKHREALKRTETELDYEFKKLLASSPEVTQMHERVCSSLCDQGDDDAGGPPRKKKKKKKAKAKAKKGKKGKDAKKEL